MEVTVSGTATSRPHTSVTVRVPSVVWEGSGEPETELEEIVGSNIRVVGDLTDISAENGTYTVPATVYVDGAEDVGAIGSYQITVQIGE